MKTEIETRFLEINKEDLISKLQALKAVNMGEVKLDEIIFYDKDLKCLENNSFVRLRKKNDKIVLTYKKNKAQGIDTAREIEFEVSDMDEAKQFIEVMGLIAYRVVEKYRHTFEIDGVTLDIDTWPKIPVYVEFESDSIEKMKSVANKLGLVWEDRFDGDAKYVFKHYGFDFDNIRTVTFDKFE